MKREQLSFREYFANNRFRGMVSVPRTVSKRASVFPDIGIPWPLESNSLKATASGQVYGGRSLSCLRVSAGLDSIPSRSAFRLSPSGLAIDQISKSVFIGSDQEKESVPVTCRAEMTGPSVFGKANT